MGKFLEAEKARQARLKQTSDIFTRAARRNGVYRKKLRPFCIPRSCAQENLFAVLREPAQNCFADKRIRWHDGKDGKPSNHLCSSQVCCVNFLGYFMDKPDVLADLLRGIFPDVRRMLPMEGSGEFLSFEWIGAENYLGERVPKNGKRTRGANFTSADASVMFETTAGLKQIVLIEWKYTESYSSVFKKLSKSGTDRSAIYSHLFGRDDCPINKSVLPSYDCLFYEPFYQFFRQQLLANEMEKAGELGATRVRVLHIAPSCNRDFRKVTSPQLRHPGDSATDVWKKLLKEPGSFLSVTTEKLFAKALATQTPWSKYISARYDWADCASGIGG